ncbi:MAG: zinc-ribbon domain-containing protein [Thermoplasmatales archaeon]|nr:MAG: zinc-ribbon domain-containing protein [Thermoplasmatales archaeon]
MVYCAKCGKKNEDDAEFCSKCGASLTGVKKEKDRCDEACVVGEHSPLAPVFWGIIVILIGLWIIFGLVIPQTELKDRLPSWLVNFEWWWLIGLIVAVAIIITGIQIITKK